MSQDRNEPGNTTPHPSRPPKKKSCPRRRREHRATLESYVAKLRARRMRSAPPVLLLPLQYAASVLGASLLMRLQNKLFSEAVQRGPKRSIRQQFSDALEIRRATKAAEEIGGMLVCCHDLSSSSIDLLIDCLQHSTIRCLLLRSGIEPNPGPPKSMGIRRTRDEHHQAVSRRASAERIRVELKPQTTGFGNAVNSHIPGIENVTAYTSKRLCPPKKHTEHAEGDEHDRVFTIPRKLHRYLNKKLVAHAGSEREKAHLCMVLTRAFQDIAKGQTLQKHQTSVGAEFCVGLLAQVDDHLRHQRRLTTPELNLKNSIQHCHLDHSSFLHIASELFAHTYAEHGKKPLINAAWLASAQYFKRLVPVATSSSILQRFTEYQGSMFVPVADTMAMNNMTHLTKDFHSWLCKFVEVYFGIVFPHGKTDNAKQKRQHAKQLRDDIIFVMCQQLAEKVSKAGDTKKRREKEAKEWSSEPGDKLDGAIGRFQSLLQRVYTQDSLSTKPSAHIAQRDQLDYDLADLQDWGTALSNVLGLRYPPDYTHLHDYTLSMHFSMALHRIRAFGGFASSDTKKSSHFHNFNVIPQTTGNRMNFVKVDNENLPHFLKNVAAYVHDQAGKEGLTTGMKNDLITLRKKLVKYCGTKGGYSIKNEWGDDVENKDIDKCWTTVLAGFGKTVDDPLSDSDGEDCTLKPDSYSRRKDECHFKRCFSTNGVELHPVFYVGKKPKAAWQKKTEGAKNKRNKELEKAQNNKKKGKKAPPSTTRAGKKKTPPAGVGGNKKIACQKKDTKRSDTITDWQGVKNLKDLRNLIARAQDKSEESKSALAEAFKKQQQELRQQAHRVLAEFNRKVKKVITVDPGAGDLHIKVFYADKKTGVFSKPAPDPLSMLAEWRVKYSSPHLGWTRKVEKHGEKVPVSGRILWRRLMHNGLNKHGGEYVLSSAKMNRATGSSREGARHREQLRKHDAYRAAIKKRSSMSPHENLHELVANANINNTIVPTILDNYVTSGRAQRRYSRFIERDKYIAKFISKMMKDEDSGEKLGKEEVVVFFGNGWESAPGSVHANRKGWELRPCFQRIMKEMDRNATLLKVDEWGTSKFHATCKVMQDDWVHGKMSEVHLDTVNKHNRKILREEQRRRVVEEIERREKNKPQPSASASSSSSSSSKHPQRAQQTTKATATTRARSATTTTRASSSSSTKKRPASSSRVHADAASSGVPRKHSDEKTRVKLPCPDPKHPGYTWEDYVKNNKLCKEASIHRLKKCSCCEPEKRTSSGHEVRHVHNRDSNACTNMYHIWQVVHASFVVGKGDVSLRPKYLCEQDFKKWEEGQKKKNKAGTK